MNTRRGTLASTRIVLAVAMVTIGACGGSSSPTATVATPTFSPGAGAINAGQKVTISTITANATIFYTMDGTQPQTSATGTTVKYTAPITITAATTIKAVATASGLTTSMVASAAYTISSATMAATPSFNPPAGAVAPGTSVTISTTTTSATIYYTTDGTDPGTSSTKYTAAIPITAAVTIKAIATASGLASSAVASAAYTLTTATTTATPTFNPAAGAVAAGTTVAISTTTTGATIYYTTDGSAPGTSSTLYTAPIPITGALTIKAIATASGLANSAVASAAYTLAAATPTFSPAAGVVAAGSTVTISTTTVGATIYYTTDGSDPGTSSMLYSAPIAITGALTIKAIATAAGLANSAVASAAYTLTTTPMADTPTFSPAAGGVASGTTVTISTTTAGATVYYTTDGSDPGTSSTPYTAPISITAAVTIKAVAAGPGLANSAVASAAYSILTPVATPTFNPAPGAVVAGTMVTISTTTTGATIYYTTDGTTPDPSAMMYAGPITITAQTTIKAMATAAGFAGSAVGSATYTIQGTAATPTFSPGAGAVTLGTFVSISTTTTGATIYYTTDGSDPGTSSTVYTTSIAITAAVTLKAIATESGFLDSAVGSAAYTILPVAATPTFNPAAGAIASGATVTISTTTAGATIYYTTDGTDPPGASPKIYTAPVAITAATTLKAIATLSGYAHSAIGSAAYTLLPAAATPTFSPAAGAVLPGALVSISTTTAGATIYYTTDGSTPGASSTPYTGPVAITAPTTLKAIATAPGFSASAVGSAAYTLLPPAATPTFSPGAGAVLTGTLVSISTTTAGATIYYTTDGTAPGTSSTQYTAPLPITAPTTIKAMATAPGLAGSDVGSATYTLLPPAGTPTFSPLAGPVNAGQAVTISSTTANATIFYTTDGSQPATSAGGSTLLYSGPVTITTATTLKAIAVATNFNNSAVGSAAYTITVVPPAATPTFSPVAGVVSSGTTVTISSATAGATIYYTTDGSQPGTSAGGSTSLYSTPVPITAATTINAVAVASGFLTSAVGSAVYTLTPAATPVFTPDPTAGAVAAGSTVTIGSTTPGAAIYYTTDGSDPGTSPSRTLYVGPITITVATTINAVATATGFADSTVATAAYTLLPSAATPTFNPLAGGVNLGTPVTISSTTPGAVIYYTTDGSTPGTSAGGSTSLYSAPVPVTAAMTINAIATASGSSPSAVGTAAYTLTPVVVQNFNTATNSGLPPGTINFNAVGGVVNPTDLVACGTGHTNALAVVNTNFNTVPTVAVNLTNPLSMYTQLKFDYYAANSDAAFKPVYLFASNTAFPSNSTFTSTVGMNNLIAAITTGNPIANKGAWATVTIDLTAAAPAGTNSQTLIAAIAAGATYFGLGESGPNGSAYFIDNIRLVDATSTVTTLTDFDTTTPALGVINFNAKSGIVNTTAFATMAANGVNPNNTNELMVLSTNFQSIPTFGSVTLPNATVLSSYKKVQITYYALNSAAAFKPAYLYASTTAFPSSTAWSTTLGSGGLVSEITAGNPIANSGSYATVTFDLTDATETSTSAIAALTGQTIFFGFGESGGVSGGITPLYFIDDVTLVP
jgi:hypothetical protein